MTTIRDATPDDVAAIVAFGAAVIPEHYTPLIGADAAHGQVERWWTDDGIRDAAANGLIIVAEQDAELGGVVQRGRHGDDHVIYKLYLHPAHRGHGLGPRLIDAVIAKLPAATERLLVEHFQGNSRAARFYEREGFAVEWVDAGPADRPELATVWRARRLPR